MSTIETQAALARQHLQAGRLHEAEQIYQQLLDLDPDNVEALHLYGVVAHQTGRSELALQYLVRSLALAPGQPGCQFNLGVVYQGIGRLQDAEQAYRIAIRMHPDFAEAHNNLGILVQAQGKLADAEAAFRKAIRLRPNYAEPRHNLGILLQTQGKLADAEITLRKASELNPSDAVVFFRLGVVLQGRGKTAEAETAYRAAVGLTPNSVEARTNLGAVLLAQGRMTEAEEQFRVALAHAPGSVEVLNNLGNSLQEQGRIPESIAILREALRVRPDFAPAVTSFLLCLNYDPASTPELLLAEHRAWGNREAHPLAAHTNDRNPERTLRVGYVSPDLRSHPVASFLEPILAHHHADQVEAYCYAEVSLPDAVSARLKTLARGWRTTVGLADDQVAALIAQERIDLLVDLAGHTSGTRLSVFARKPAPITVSYLGYPNTTGVSAIDYRLTDAVADPPGEPPHHTEELWRLPGCFCCYAPPAKAPDVAPLPAQRNGCLTFGSLHHLAKLNDQVLDLWAQVLHAVPTARLLIGRHTLTGGVADRLRAAFTNRGIHSSRLDLRQSFPGGHLTAYADFDIALDVFPWGGHTTACESLWMGVPVLTLRGDRHAGRMVASILTTVGLGDWIAAAPSDYVARAAAAAGDVERLAALRANLRERVRTSPLCDAEAFTRGLEAAFRGMWQRWCATIH